MRQISVFCLFVLCSGLQGQIKLSSHVTESVGRWSIVTADHGDIDHDGDIDFIINGFDSDENRKTKLFENVNGNFVEKELLVRPDLISGKVKLGDLNGDDLLDIIVTGSNYTDSRTPWSHPPSFYSLVQDKVSTEIFINNGNWNFEKLEGSFLGFFHTSINVVDYNNDGLNDIFLSGLTFYQGSNTPQSVIYENLGDLQFKELLVALPKVKLTESDWYDYDKDGFPDLVFSGMKDDRVYETHIYRNIGMFDQKDSENRILMFEENTSRLETFRHSNSVLEFIDLNNDGEKDIFQSHHDEVNFYANRGNGEFEYVENDFEINSGSGTYADYGDLNGDGNVDILLTRYQSNIRPMLILTDGNFGVHRAISIDHTNVGGSTGNFTRYGFFNDFDYDDRLDIFLLGSNTFGGSESKIYLSKGGFATLDLALVDITLRVSRNYDLDGDGDLDIIASPNFFHNDGWYVLYNNGNYDFSASRISGLPSLKEVDFEIADYNKDGIIDLFLTGLSESNDVTSALFNFDGQNSFSKNAFNFEQLYSGSIEWYDFDHDSDLDLFYTGAQKSQSEHSSEDYPFDLLFKIYENVQNEVGAGTTFRELSNEIEPTINGEIEFGDLDNDGIEEFLITGNSDVFGTNSGIHIFHVYDLDIDRKEYTQENILEGVQDGKFRLLDLNNDGFLDLVLIGTFFNDGVFHFRINDRKKGFGVIQTLDSEFPNSMTDPKIQVVDLDLDGRPDIVVKGRAGGFGYFNMLKNTDPEESGNPIFTPFFSFSGYGGTHIDAELNIGDLDGDGDPELFTTTTSKSLRILDNLSITGEIDEALSAPSNVQVSSTNRRVEINWDNPNDVALTYHVFVDDGSNSDQTFESLSNSKFQRLKVGRIGKINSEHFELTGLMEGDYQFKILGVNNALQTTPFSETISFTLEDPIASIEPKISGNKVNVFPNPSENSRFIISSEESPIKKIAVLNSVGKIVFESVPSQRYLPEMEVILKRTGLFLIKIELINGQYSTKKVLMK